jgi:hypothetical protein
MVVVLVVVGEAPTTVAMGVAPTTEVTTAEAGRVVVVVAVAVT